MTTPAPTTAPAAPERIAVVTGDRACIACGFNLHGQHVVRESHYDMLMVRCPECGQVASLHEYPVLGPWAKRVGFVLAALWLLVMLAAVGATAGALMGGAILSSEAMLSGVTREISAAHARHADERLKEVENEIARLQADQDESVRALSRKGTAPEQDQLGYAQQSAKLATLSGQRQTLQWMAQQSAAPNSWVDEEWWKTSPGKAEMVRGLWLSIDWRTSFWTLLGAGLMPLIAGVFWGVTSPRWRGRGRGLLLAWVVLVLFGVGGLVMASAMRLTVSQMQMWAGIKMAQASGLARELTGLTPTILTFAAMSLLLLVAMRFGRAWARLAVRALLPPRMRTSLAYLWWCDGKEMPGTGASRRGA